MKSSREQFEDWFSLHFPGERPLKFPWFDGVNYVSSSYYGPEFSMTLRNAWAAWKASREAMLPVRGDKS